MTASKPHPARALAAKTLTQIFNHAQSYQQCVPTFEHHPQKSLIQALCFEVIREYPKLKALLALLLQSPIKSKNADIEHCLLIGLHELQQQQTPDYAVVNETVKAVKALKRNWAVALVNGCCREFARHPARYLEKVANTPRFPDWWLTQWQADWPDDFNEIVTAQGQHAPMICRVNINKISRDDYLAHCAKANLAATAYTALPQAIVLETPCTVEQLPGFDDDWVVVQDASAQLAAPLLSAAPGERVLDACAAPGGKTTHLFEQQPTLDVVAIDQQAKRLEKVQAICKKRELNVQCIAADGCDVEAWFDGRAFDKILLDAPCSGSGVIRRHPDITYCRTPEMITELQALQTRLLQACWQTLKPGGRCLYVTCSIVQAENEDVIAAFCQQEDSAKPVPINLPWGRAMQHGWQTLPGEGGGDGFYFCLLEKHVDQV